MSKYIIAVITTLLFSFNTISFSQKLNNNKYQIQGPASVPSNALVKYTLVQNPSSPVSFSWSVNNGVIVSQNTNPSNGAIYVDIQWPNLVGNGMVILTDNTTGDVSTQKVAIINFQDFAIACSEIVPHYQELTYGVPPQLLTFNVCNNLSSFLNYQITFEWTIAPNIPNMVPVQDEAMLPWEYIKFGSNIENYQPAPLFNYGINAYRRKITISTLAGVELKSGYSTAAYVQLSYLKAGSITTADNQVQYNNHPAITQMPAYGGLCTVHDYEWQMKNSSDNWVVIGYGVDYPTSTAPTIKEDVYIRRKVTCGTDVLYTNELYIALKYVSPWAENRNYIRVNTIAIPNVPNWYEADQLKIGDKFQQTTYLDGFGRAIQSVSKESAYMGSGTWGDMTKHIEYDAAGRSTKGYLPSPTLTDIGFLKLI